MNVPELLVGGWLPLDTKNVQDSNVRAALPKGCFPFSFSCCGVNIQQVFYSTQNSANPTYILEGTKNRCRGIYKDFFLPASGVLLDLKAGEAEQSLPDPGHLAAGQADGPEAPAAGGAAVVAAGLLCERLLARPLAGPAVVVNLVAASNLLLWTVPLVIVPLLTVPLLETVPLMLVSFIL